MPGIDRGGRQRIVGHHAEAVIAGKKLDGQNRSIFIGRFGKNVDVRGGAEGSAIGGAGDVNRWRDVGGCGSAALAGGRLGEGEQHEHGQALWNELFLHKLCFDIRYEFVVTFAAKRIRPLCGY